MRSILTVDRQHWNVTKHETARECVAGAAHVLVAAEVKAYNSGSTLQLDAEEFAAVYDRLQRALEEMRRGNV
jgi:hypothetical protein